MKRLISIIAIIAMLVPAVQGYAQGPRREGGHSSSRSAPSRSHSAPSRSYSAPRQSYSSPSRSTAPRQSYSSPSRSTAPRQSYTAPSRSTAPRQSATAPTRTAPRQGYVTQPRSTTPRQSATAPTRTAPQRQGVTTTPRNSAPRNNGTVTRSAPPRHNAPRHATPPPPRHHSGHHHHHGYLSHGHHHHHHHCVWDTWRYYTYGGYHNRFICHSYYRDRYFDSLLGYYLYGSFDRPTRLEIGGLSLTRYNGQLQIRNGSSYSYMNLWQSQTVQYVSNYTTISISTGNGYAIIYFYDDYGNEATYQL